MLEKIAISSKAKIYVLEMAVIAVVLLVISTAFPLYMGKREIQSLGDKSLLIAKATSTAIGEAYSKELEKLRSNPNPDSAEFKKLNGVLTEIAENLGADKVFTVYKGIGGKYYTLLESGHNPENIGAQIDDKYLKYKNLLDKISGEKTTSSYSTSLIDGVHGKSVVAWSSLTNSKGYIVGIIGIENSLNNREINTFNMGKFYLILVSCLSCLILSILLFTLAVKILLLNQKINKGAEKEGFTADPTRPKPKKTELVSFQEDEKEEE